MALNSRSSPGRYGCATAIARWMRNPCQRPMSDDPGVQSRTGDHSICRHAPVALASASKNARSPDRPKGLPRPVFAGGRRDAWVDDLRTGQCACGAAVVARAALVLGSCDGAQDRKSVVWGKSVSLSVDRGGGRIIKKKKNKT